MDEMNIVSKFTNGIISRILKGIIKKNFGINADIDIKSIRITVSDNSTNAHVELDAAIANKDITTLIGKAGLF